MANLTNATNLIAQQDFRLRVILGCVEAAVDICAENPQTAGHAQRKALAQEVLAAPLVGGQRFIFAVATNDTVSANGAATDSEIAFVVASTWNALAGV
jgi:hypothetical protein